MQTFYCCKDFCFGVGLDIEGGLFALSVNGAMDNGVS